MTHPPVLAGTVDALLPRLRESPQKAKAARCRNNPCPASSRNQIPPDESRRIIHRPQCLSETRIPQAREEQTPLKRLTRQPRSNIRAIAGIRHTTGTISLCHNQQRRARARGDKPVGLAENLAYVEPRPRG